MTSVTFKLDPQFSPSQRHGGPTRAPTFDRPCPSVRAAAACSRTFYGNCGVTFDARAARAVETAERGHSVGVWACQCAASALAAAATGMHAFKLSFVSGPQCDTRRVLT